MKHGYVQVYTGNGKGKTTASVGLALRAIVAGFHVYYAQFMKQGYTGEKIGLTELAQNEKVKGKLTYEQFGNGTELRAPDAQADAQAAREGYVRAQEILGSNDYDVVILDEINVATWLGYITEDEGLDLIRNKPESTELILTGRGALQSVMDAADLVTEMHEQKHYYNQGVMARKGIEM